MEIIGFWDIQYRHSLVSYNWSRNVRRLLLARISALLSKEIASFDMICSSTKNGVGTFWFDTTMPIEFGEFTIGTGQVDPELGIVSQSAYDLVLAPYQS